MSELGVGTPGRRVAMRSGSRTAALSALAHPGARRPRRLSLGFLTLGGFVGGVMFWGAFNTALE